MMKFIKSIIDAIKPVTRQERVEKYLSEARDMVDLERRLRNIEKRSDLDTWI